MRAGAAQKNGGRALVGPQLLEVLERVGIAAVGVERRLLQPRHAESLVGACGVGGLAHDAEEVGDRVGGVHVPDRDDVLGRELRQPHPRRRKEPPPACSPAAEARRRSRRRSERSEVLPADRAPTALCASGGLSRAPILRLTVDRSRCGRVFTERQLFLSFAARVPRPRDPQAVNMASEPELSRRCCLTAGLARAVLIHRL